jgi:hypothetical protein
MGFRAVGVGDPERYLLRTSAARIGVDDVASMSRDEHRHAFLAFVAGLIGDFDRYLARDEIDPCATEPATTWRRCGSMTRNSRNSRAN